MERQDGIMQVQTLTWQLIALTGFLISALLLGQAVQSDVHVQPAPVSFTGSLS